MLKMKELMQQSGESKSTILYYLKEGLLPQPQKPKPNVHLYDKKCVKIIKFIKYLQENLHYSIAQIKEIFASNNFNFDDDFEMIIASLKALSSVGKHYSKEDFLELSGLSKKELEEFEKLSLIYSYTDKELEIVSILKEAKELGVDFELFKSYVKSAKELALLEYEEGAKLTKEKKSHHDRIYKMLFDIILTVKPYIFNQQTIIIHKRKHDA